MVSYVEEELKTEIFCFLNVYFQREFRRASFKMSLAKNPFKMSLTKNPNLQLSDKQLVISRWG